MIHRRHTSRALARTSAAALCLASLAAASASPARAPDAAAAQACFPEDAASGNTAPDISAVDGAAPDVSALPAPPDVLYGDLFVAVQSAQLFEDPKVFVDAIPLFHPEQIVDELAEESSEPGFDLRAFVDSHFTLPVDQSITPPENQSLRDHINWLWPELTRTTTTVPPWSSLIPLPKPYVVPGGRFREVYYWDSYFTMLGLAEAGLDRTVLDMVRDFAFEIDSFGHIPNGNRTYYLSRSQPPFFSHMVELAARLEGNQVYVTYLPQLQREHGYWMAGREQTPPGGASAHVVVLPDGTVLNRYWDALDTPRSESFIQDVQTAQAAVDRPAREVYRDLRAAAESGWDFSSRWLGDRRTLTTIRTTSIVPVDLNSLLFHLESTIVKACQIARDTRCVRNFGRQASERARAIERYLYDEQGGFYADYDHELGVVRDDITAAALYPLFVGVARRQRAHETTEHVGAALLETGGLSTSTIETGEQWDAPNGWAPLQWIAIEGLERYGEHALAQQIGTRFLASVEAVYAGEQKLVESTTSRQARRWAAAANTRCKTASAGRTASRSCCSIASAAPTQQPRANGVWTRRTIERRGERLIKA